MSKWLYHFVFPATVNESSCFFTSSWTFDVSFSEFWSFLIGVSYLFKKIVFSWCNMKHFSMYLFAICISYLVRYLLKWNEVAQLCPTFCDPMDCTLPDSSIHGIFQARALEWVAISFSITRWWCHPTISFSGLPFSSCLQSFLAPGYPNRLETSFTQWDNA